MSDDSSTVITPPDQSLSTDSEESFLIEELNKSLLSNNSISNSSSSSSGTKNKRNFFRESYIDDAGINRTFSILQDPIDETTEHNNDLTGLSTLDTEKLRESPNKNVLSIAFTNVGGYIKSTSLNEKPHTSKPKSHRHCSAKSNYSEGSSIYDAVPQNIMASEIEKGAQFSPITPNSSKKPTIPLPNPPLNNTNTPPYTSDISRYGTTTNKSDRVKSSIINFYLNSEVTPDTTVYQTSIDATTAQGENFPVPLESLQASNTSNILSSVTEDKNPKKKRSQTPLASATKSETSSKHKETILTFEQSRKTTKGIPHLLLHNSEKVLPQGVSITEYSQHLDATKSPYISSEDDFSVRIKSQDEIRISQTDMLAKTNQLKDFNSESFEEDKLLLEKRRRDQKCQNGKGRTQEIRLPSTNSSISEDSEFFRDIHYNDQLLEKIHYYGRQPPFYDSRNMKEKSNRAGWILYLISFLIPPLFFFLGFGLLDQYVPDRFISTQIKKISIYTGIFMCVLTIGMTVLGFAYGILHARP